MGVAPALIDRAVTGEPAGLKVLAIGGTSILLGGVCVMLFVLMRSGGCWPMRVAFGLSLSLVTIALGGWVLAGGHSVSLFLLVSGRQHDRCNLAVTVLPRRNSARSW